MPSDDEIKEAMGTWLGQLAPWDVFSTWTFSRPTQVSGAMFWALRHLRWLENKAKQPIYGFVGLERGKTGGLVHLHALLGNVGHLKPYCGTPLPPGQWRRACCMSHGWPCGYARVFPYNPELGARYYVSKYVSKRLAEWQLVGFPAMPQTSLPVTLGRTTVSSWTPDNRSASAEFIQKNIQPTKTPSIIVRSADLEKHFFHLTARRNKRISRQWHRSRERHE